jgi:hypothetical protein
MRDQKETGVQTGTAPDYKPLYINSSPAFGRSETTYSKTKHGEGAGGVYCTVARFFYVKLLKCTSKRNFLVYKLVLST